MNNPLVGRGWAFPPKPDGRGGLGLAADTTEIEQAIHIILGTGPGQRVMRPDFGCKIHDLAFAPINAHTLGLVQRYVEEAIGWWEPRVDLVEVQVETDASMRAVGKLIIHIRYRLKGTDDERSLVYPFYTIGEER
ncbi:MAG: GPW/gp25 family protein [Anaerolineales bacterium]|nr:GPW/gp25 family protein [Anaerolineales bacterium]